MTILSGLLSKKRKKSIAVLIDPDNVEDDLRLDYFFDCADKGFIDYFFVGGSLIMSTNFSDVIKKIKTSVSVPVVIFPGNGIQISGEADGILLLSLISGRNPDLLIGQHVTTAPILKTTQLEIIPTGYLLINSGRVTSAAYISNTTPIPSNKPSLAACTAMAGTMLGLRVIYLDAGSGANETVPSRLVKAVREAVDTPLIVGGGIDTGDKALAVLKAGADVVVLGNVLEKNPKLLVDVAEKTHALSL